MIAKKGILMYKKISSCRICKNTNLVPIINLGEQCLTGFFPLKDSTIPSYPLSLVICDHRNNSNKEKQACGLVQLEHQYLNVQLYGENYGYRSGLNKSMVKHLETIYKEIKSHIQLGQDDLVIDIGSNDGTLLGFFSEDNLKLVGVDPSGEKFRKFYKPKIELIVDFFSHESVKNLINAKKAKVIASIAMFYDLEDPNTFIGEINNTLDTEGIWVFEQSYLPAMIEANAYDTICHEHIEYYGLKQIKYLLDNNNFKIINFSFNNSNGGSFRITAAKKNSSYREITDEVDKIIKKEIEIQTPEYFSIFEKNVIKSKNDLVDLLQKLTNNGKKILGYGASTKGNVLLQYCQITQKIIPYIGEINPDKFRRTTPGTLIPIISEEEAKEMKPDYFLVLPWHFKEHILNNEKKYLENGGHFIFPLPAIEII